MDIMTMPDMIADAFARVCNALADGGCPTKGNMQQRTARCPAHPDTNPSLSITRGNGAVLVKCHAGCHIDDILTAIGLKPGDLFDPDAKPKGGARKRILETYDYVDESGTLLFQAIRYEPKDFSQRRPGDNGEWIYNLKDTRRVLYHLPQLIEAINAGKSVWIVEGEKDVHALEARRQIATCNPQGAGKWRVEYAEHLHGARVTIVADRDKPGRDHARTVARSLEKVGATWRVVEPAVNVEKADTTDHFRDGHGVQDFIPVDLNADDTMPPPPEPEDEEAPTTPSRPTLTVVGQPDGLTLTDDGNALRLVDRHSHEIRYCPQRGWLHWSGHRWAWDDAGMIYEHARDLARSLPQGDKEWTKHRHYSLMNRGLNNMVAVAQTDPRIVADIDHLDRRPYELNTPDGIVDLRTSALHSADPAALHTRSTTCGIDPERSPTRWLTFLAETFAGDPDLTTYVQRLLGVSLVGVVLEQLLPFAYGAGANGKTTLLDIVQQIIGVGDSGYSIPAPAELLLATYQQGHPTEIARLSGARLVVTSELEEGQRFAEARVKLLTGRDTITGRFMRQDYFSFIPTHTLWLLANHQPVVKAGGPAFWRRLRLLPFLHTVPTAQRDTTLAQKLVAAEGSAILAWLVQGAADYLGDGLAEPGSVTAATDAYAKDQDTVARFVEECCVIGSHTMQGMGIIVAALRDMYEKWSRQEGESPLSPKAFGTALTTRFGVVQHRTSSQRWYLGIRLQTHFETQETEEDASPDASPLDESTDEQQDKMW